MRVIETHFGRLAFGRVTIKPERQVIVRPVTLLFARILMSAIFIYAGLTKLMSWSPSAEYIATEGLRPAALFLGAAAIVELAGGISILTGTLTRIGALLLFLFLIPTTLIFHDFWAFAGEERQMQLVTFMKNLAIMGGLLAFAACGPGRYSVDRQIELKDRRKARYSARSPMPRSTVAESFGCITPYGTC